MEAIKIRSFEQLGELVTEKNVESLSTDLYLLLKGFIKTKKKHPKIVLNGMDWKGDGKAGMTGVNVNLAGNITASPEVEVKKKTDKEILANIKSRYGKTHTIKKRMFTNVSVTDLKDNESVCYGDGATYHFLLTKKKVKK